VKLNKLKGYMKKTFVMMGLLLAVAGCDKMKGAGGSSGDFKTDEQKYSYALGQQFGKNLASLEVPVDKRTLINSLEDALAGKEGKMDDKQIQEAMMMLRDARMGKMKEVGEKNKKEGDEFLAKNKGEEGVKTTASGLQYKVITEGKGAKPSATDTVEVHYAGTLTDGSEFDSSYKRNAPATFPVNGVIKGWTEALQLMSEGSKWKLFIPAELAYGNMDRPGIPANSVLVFDVELLKVVKAGAAAKPAAPAKKK
jgi:FKBP-type peptidyl-prolyl cis-trans isomerase